MIPTIVLEVVLRTGDLDEWLALRGTVLLTVPRAVLSLW
jgi:hypothetical protein